MMSNNEENAVAPEDGSLVEQINAQYTPLPMTTVQRVEFNKTLDAALKKRSRERWKPVAVGFAGFALGLWAIAYLVVSPVEEMRQSGQTIVASETREQLLSHEVLVTWGIDEWDAPVLPREGELPDEYLAISQIIIEF